MGAQLAKDSPGKPRPGQLSSTRRRSSVDSDISSPIGVFVSSSALTRPIGSAPPPTSHPTVKPKPAPRPLPADIVIVNEGQSGPEEVISLPPLFKPLIPIGYETLAPNQPRLDHQLVVNMANIVQEEMRTKAELMAKEQAKLGDRIKEADGAVSVIGNQFVNDRQRRAIKFTENFAKIDEIGCLIDRCEEDIRRCCRSLDTLNRYLPQGLRLEKIDLRKGTC